MIPILSFAMIFSLAVCEFCLQQPDLNHTGVNMHTHNYHPGTCYTCHSGLDAPRLGANHTLSNALHNADTPVVKLEIQTWGNCSFRFWHPVGGCRPLIGDFGPLVPLLVVAGPETTKLTCIHIDVFDVDSES